MVEPLPEEHRRHKLMGSWDTGRKSRLEEEQYQDNKVKLVATMNSIKAQIGEDTKNKYIY